MLDLNFFEVVFKEAPVSSIVVLPDAPRYTIICTTRAFNRITHTEEHHLLNKGIFDVFSFDPIEGNSTLKKRLDQVLATKSTVKGSIERYIVPTEGSESCEIKYWLPESTPVLDGSGNVQFIIHSVLDVGDKVLVEEREKSISSQLLINQEQYRSLFDHHPDAVVAFDLEGNFMSANQSMARMAECSLEDVLKATYGPFIAPEDSDRVAEHFEKAIKGEIQKYITGFISAKGNRLVISGTLLPIIVNNELIGVFGIGKDITQETIANQKLKQSREQLRKILEHSSDLICTIDENRRFIRVSKASEAILNYLPEELEGKPYIDLIVEHDRNETIALADQLRVGIPVKSIENRCRRRDGRIITMSWSVHWDEEERISYCVGRDITEIKALNDRIENSEKRFRTILQNSTEGITLYDADGTILERSLSAMKIMELEDIGMKIDFDLLHPEDALVAEKAFQEIKSIDNHITTLELRFLRRSGTYKWIEVTFHNQLNDPYVMAVVATFRDITERKLTAQMIQNNEKRFKSLLKNSTDGLSLYNSEGSLLEISETGLKILEYAEHELLGKVNPELIHPDDLQVISQAFVDVLNDPRIIKCFEFRFLLSNGTYKWIEANFQNHLNEPAVNAMVMNFRDITGRIKASETLRTNEDRYRRLFHNNPLPMWIYELESYKFLEVNQAAIEKYGYTEEEFLQMKISDIRPEEDIKHLKNLKGTTTKYGVRYNGYWRHLKKNGQLLYADITSQTLDYKNCKANLILANDVTEKIIAENALKLNEQRFKALVQEGSDLISIIEQKGNYKYVSPAYSSLLGIDVEKLIGQNAYDFIHDDDKERLCKSLCSLKKNRRVKLKPYRFKDCNGEYRWFESIGTNLTGDPAVQGIVVNSRDITDSMNYLRTIEDQNLKLREIAWLQSHIVRAPVSRIMGLINLFKNYPETMETADLLNSLLDSADELDDVIRDIVRKTDEFKQSNRLLTRSDC